MAVTLLLLAVGVGGCVAKSGGGNASVEARTTTAGQELKDLKAAHDKGLISDREYERMRREIVALRKEKETYLARFKSLAEAQIQFVETHQNDFEDLDRRGASGCPASYDAGVTAASDPVLSLPAVDSLDGIMEAESHCKVMVAKDNDIRAYIAAHTLR